VEVQTVSREVSVSQRAAVARPSNGMQALRSMSSSSSSRCGALAIAAAASPVDCSMRAATLPGTSSWTSLDASRAASMPTTTGRVS
jgi:hypothetical protein